MSQENVQRLLRDAVTAQREGDPDRARVLLEQVVELDPQNEKGWFWLASVARTDEERLIYLGNVVHINPNNERAKALLAQLERKSDETLRAGTLDEEVAPGVSRRTLLFLGMLFAVVILLVIVVMVIVSNNNTQQANAAGTATGIVVGTQSAQQTEVAVIAANATGTAEALALLETVTPDLPTLPPTWTPRPSPTPLVRTTPTPLATIVGSGLTRGRLAIASGQDFTGEGWVPLVEIALDGTGQRTLFEGRANNLTYSRSELYAYTRYSSGTGDQGIEIAWRDGSQSPRLLSSLLPVGTLLAVQDDPSFSPDGTTLTFSAREPGSLNGDIYILSLTLALDATTGTGDGGGEGDLPDELAARVLQRLTDGVIDNTAPDWIDPNRLVFVADARDNGGGSDLQIIEISSGAISNLTIDGAALIEDNPNVSPDGARVVFSAYSPQNPADVDLFIVPVSGGTPALLIDSPGADIDPHWSPDGNFVAFASDRTGNFEVFIVEVASGDLYQVTVNGQYDTPNDWRQS
ncbi:MAG: PD40 domain-containing protein [Anaerolineae bacterium]|nr:PD40 domain-containing protein [Anaerolineae bacterium]